MRLTITLLLAVTAAIGLTLLGNAKDAGVTTHNRESLEITAIPRHRTFQYCREDGTFLYFRSIEHHINKIYVCSDNLEFHNAWITSNMEEDGSTISDELASKLNE